jgi:hypothetical protein
LVQPGKQKLRSSEVEKNRTADAPRIRKNQNNNKQKEESREKKAGCQFRVSRELIERIVNP